MQTKALLTTAFGTAARPVLAILWSSWQKQIRKRYLHRSCVVAVLVTVLVTVLVAMRVAVCCRRRKKADLR